MDIIKFYEFRSYFKDVSLKGKDIPAKDMLGNILSDLPGSAGDKTEILKAAKELAEIPAQITDSSQKNLSNGQGNDDIAWAFYYWLHVNMPEIEQLSEVDHLLLNKKTFAEICKRPVKLLERHHTSLEAKTNPSIKERLYPAANIPSENERWDAFLEEYSRYDGIKIYSGKKLDSLSISELSKSEPIADLRIALFQEYRFELSSHIEGYILGFEGYKGKWYLMETGLTKVNYRLAKIPYNAFKKEDQYFIDREHEGIHTFVFITSHKNLSTYFTQSKSNSFGYVPSDVLDVFLDDTVDFDKNNFAVFKINVCFYKNSYD